MRRSNPGPRSAPRPPAGRPRSAARAAPEKPAGGGCPDTARLLSRYLEGDLDAHVCETLSAHVADCDQCERVCTSLRELLGACRRWGAAPLPVAERARVRAALRDALADLPSS